MDDHVNPDDAPPSQGARTATFALTLLIATLTVAGGAVVIQARANASSKPPAAPLIAVETYAPVLSSEFLRERRFTGRVEATRTTDIAFELSGSILQMAVNEGDQVNAGEVLAALDTRSLNAERNRLDANRATNVADLELARLTLTRQQRLRKQGFSPDQDFDEARLSVDRANAALKQIEAALVAVEIQLEKSTLRAPFPATVGLRSVDEGATVSPGMPIVRLLEQGAPQVRIGVPPDVANRLLSSNAYTINISGVAYDAQLASIRPDVASVTRTQDVLFTLGDSPLTPATAAYGDIAELSFLDAIAADGYQVPLAALSEGERGLWTLLSVSREDDGFIVTREAVEILHLAGDEAYVRGTLDPSSRLIQSGRHRVVAGQRVQITDTSSLQ